MKKVILYIFLLSILTMFVGGAMGYYLLAKIMLGSTLFFGFTGFYLLCLHVYRTTSRAAKTLTDESKKAYASINLFYRLERAGSHQGARQYRAAGKKNKLLLRLLKSRFTTPGLTYMRFKQEVDSYCQKITRNLEQLVFNKESLTSVDPTLWRQQIRALERAGASKNQTALQELQQQLRTYTYMEQQSQELLSENEQLLSDMDKAILALNQENYQLHIDKHQGQLFGEASFMHRYLYANK